MSANKDLLDDQFAKGSDIDLSKAKFRGKLAGKAWKLEQAEEKIKRAKIILFALAVLSLVPVFLLMATGNYEPLFVISYLLNSAFFLGCALLTKKQPVLALLAALSFYLLSIVVVSGGEIVKLYQGFAWKGAVIAFLGIGLFYAIIANRTKQDIIKSLQEQQLDDQTPTTD